MWAASQRPGLRLKLNLVILPLVLGPMAFFVWLDYRHEVGALMNAHGMHAEPAGTDRDAGPVPRELSPRAIGRRALMIHAAHAGVTVVLVMFGVNAALAAFVLRPLAAIDAGIARMERGQWRAWTNERGGDDEVGRLLTNFRSLGVTVDALVSQSLNAERLATAAILAKALTCRLEPEVERLGAAAAALQRAPDRDTQALAAEVASAAAHILAAARSLDNLFERPVRAGPARNWAAARPGAGADAGAKASPGP